MKNKNGFSLIEILAVIIIIGIVMIIAVPAVSKYILKSDKAVYASNVQAYLETIRGKYEMKEYGALLKDNEIMIVPIEHVILEKGDSKSTPYGDYDFKRSFILIVPENKGYNYYATVIDTAKAGLLGVPANKIGEDAIREGITDDIPILDTYKLPNTTYTYAGKTYKRSDVRNIEGEDVNSGFSVFVFKETN